MTLGVVVGLGLAAVAWGALFVPGRTGFWNRALVAGTVIAAYAAAAERHRLAARLVPTVADVVVGVVSGAALYGVFRGGDRALKAVVPAMARQVAELYTVRATGPRCMPVILVVVGACEEVFWRGFVQARAGFVVALAGYAAVHVWERKAVLVVAAVAAGAAWGALFAWRGSLVAPLVSHALWDLAVVVWFPFRPADEPPAGTGLTARRRPRTPWSRGRA